LAHENRNEFLKRRISEAVENGVDDDKRLPDALQSALEEREQEVAELKNKRKS
jgi:hypothetical protein